MTILMKWLAAIAVAFALAGVVGCSATATRESTGQYVDDSSITTKVKAKFVEDKTVSALRIHVETFQGVVQLSGFVDNANEMAAAQRIASNVAGVQRVDNRLSIR